jgi:hypothetical protein
LQARLARISADTYASQKRSHKRKAPGSLRKRGLGERHVFRRRIGRTSGK